MILRLMSSSSDIMKSHCRGRSSFQYHNSNNRLLSSPFRTYFNNSDDNDDDKYKKNDDDEDDNKASPDDDTPSSSSGGGGDSEKEGSKKSKKSKKSSMDATNIVVPTKLPFGESAPRIPHMHAVPLVSRPLFPGLLTSVTITDERTIDALEEVHKGNSYVSCFLRSKHSNGVISETGTILTQPELITDPLDLYNVGTFAQIQKIKRGELHNKPTAEGSDFDIYNNTTSHAAATVLLVGHRRVDLVSVDNIGPPIDVTVKHWSHMDYVGLSSSDNDSIRALSNEIISTIREVAQTNDLFRELLQLFPIRFDVNDPYRLADFAASLTASGTPEELQAVLNEKNPEMRLHKALVLLIHEREVTKLQKEINRQVTEKLSESQRKYFLMEQLKAIKRELGMEVDDKDVLLEKYRATLRQYPSVPKEAMDVINAEMEKFASLEKNSAEYNVTRSYLDWLTGIPWNVLSDENYHITQARQILDSQHYGLEDVKTTILQFIAIGKLQGGSIQGKILCLAGPPGTGKTSIANSIATALGRKFYRFSVGGLSDVSEIKGHRRTYVGAMPGKIIQCLKTTGTFNAVCLIDEIDKLGKGYYGDPAGALLEVLDPSQNSTFRDYYIDTPVDISKILFICTANELDRIPGPLLDRMEIIRLSGYDVPEKVAIAEQYLVPKSLRDSGLMVDPAEIEKKKQEDEKKKQEDEKTTMTKSDHEEQNEQGPQDEQSKEGDHLNVQDDNVAQTPPPTPVKKYVHSEGVPNTLTITKDAIQSLVRWYAREAGVRNLAKYIDKITRKLALQVVAESEGTDLTEKARRKTESWIIDENNVAEYVGKPVFTSDRMYETGPLPSGIVMGLAYTSMGGTALYIETQGIKRGLDENGKPRGGGSLKATGQLGDVMQESSQIAYTVARSRLSQIDPNNTYFDLTDIHMHVPEGATPKDGPSAGVTMVTSMLSLAMDKPIRNDVAMTGETSLTGKVLAVGGIKEKIMAARRAGIKIVVLPDANRRDFDEIPAYLKDGLEVHYADSYDKVYSVAFSQ